MKPESIIIRKSPYDGLSGHPPYSFYHVRLCWGEEKGDILTVAHLSISNCGLELTRVVAQALATKFDCPVKEEL